MRSLAPSHLPSPELCPGCSSQVGEGLLACPGCGRLVHGDRLRELAAEAEKSEASVAVQKWREALQLLPTDSPQARSIQEKLSHLAAPSSPVPRSLSGLGALGLLLWKFKSLIVGLTKFQTLWTMVVSLGAMAMALGWPFAAVLILSIYVHEMGHVSELQRLGFQFEMPRFIPGVGAYVMLKQKCADPVEDARIGLAGPWWGLGAAAVCYGLSFLTLPTLLLAGAKYGALLNLINLFPIWPLDGGRGLRALSQSQRGAIVLLGLLLLYASNSGLILLFVLLTGLRWLFAAPEKPDGDSDTFRDYAVLLSLLTWMSQFSVKLPTA